MKLLIPAMFALLLAHSATNAEDTLDQAGQTVPEQFLQGGWITDASNTRYIVSSGLPANQKPTPIRFYSGYFADGINLSYRITTERGSAVATVPEAGGVLIEGKDIELSRNAPGTGQATPGGWVALTQPVLPDGFAKFSWSAYPNGISSQVMDLNAAKHFVLTFAGHSNPACNNGTVSIVVDGKPLTYRDKTAIRLLPGASVWSFGKSVVVQWNGTCTLTGTGPTGGVPLAGGTMKVAY